MAATMPVEKKNQWPKVGIENCSKQSLSSLCGCGVVFRDGVTKWCLLLLCSLVSTYLFCENVFFSAYLLCPKAKIGHMFVKLLGSNFD